MPATFADTCGVASRRESVSRCSDASLALSSIEKCRIHGYIHGISLGIGRASGDRDTSVGISLGIWRARQEFADLVRLTHADER